MGTILSYVFYWIAVIVSLVYLKWKEVCCFELLRQGTDHLFGQGRAKVLGVESAAGMRRRNRREAKQDLITNEQKDEAVVEEYTLPK